MVNALLEIRINRSIDEKDFGKIQRDRISEMQRCTDELKNVRRFEKDVKAAMVAANNHYEGFGPRTLKTFQDMMDLSK